MDTLNRAGLDGLLNLVFRGPFLIDDLCLVCLFIEFKDLRADLLAGTAADTLLFIYENLACHKKPPPLVFQTKISEILCKSKP
jgi:hypothetical protein